MPRTPTSCRAGRPPRHGPRRRRSRPRRAPAAAATAGLDPVFAVVARYFGVLSEPTRLKILHTICQDERSVSAIVAATGATQTNVSRHLALMLAAGVVSRRRAGNVVFYRVAEPGVRRHLPDRVRADRKPHRRAEAVEAGPAAIRRRALTQSTPRLAQWRSTTDVGTQGRSGPHSPGAGEPPRRAAGPGPSRLPAPRGRHGRRRARGNRGRARLRRRRPDEEPAAERARVEPHARRARPRVAVRRAVEVRGQRQAPRKSRAHPHAAFVGRVHAAAEPVRHHHAVGPALRAAPRGHAGRRPAPAPADDPRARREPAHLHDGRHRALPVRVARPLHRVRREHGHGVGQRRGADRPVHARDALVQRVDRRAARDAPRRGRASTGRRRSSCWPKARTARR